MSSGNPSPYVTDNWKSAENVSAFLNRNDIASCDFELLGGQLSGAAVRSFCIKTKDGKEEHYVLKIGVHKNQRLGRHREAAFYQNFASGINGQERQTEYSALVPKVHFCQFEVAGEDTEDKYEERVVALMEKLDGCDSGLFFGNHSPHNWKFASDEALEKEIKEKHGISSGVTVQGVATESARISARLHAPLFGFNQQRKQKGGEDSSSSSSSGEQFALSVLNDPKFQHAACRDWLLAADKAEAPRSWTEAMNFSKLRWEAELERLAKLSDEEKQLDKNKTPFCFSESVVQCLHAAFEKTTWNNYRKEFLENCSLSLVHGDHHPGNYVVLRSSSSSSSPKLILVDWEMHRFGSGPQDIGQYMVSHATPELRRQLEPAVLSAYCDEMKAAKVPAAANAESFAAYVRSEYAAGGAGRWLWFLPVLAVMCGGGGSKMSNFFHDQVKAFLDDHKIGPQNVPVMRC